MKKKRQSGFTLVELLLVIALGLVMSVGILGLFRIGLIGGTRSSFHLQARNLVQEGMEAIVAIRDTGGSNWDWTATPVNTNANEYYQPTIVGNAWSLGAKSSVLPAPTLSPPNNRFTRTVTIQSVQRAAGCGSAVCPIVNSGGILDTGTRKITVVVSWQDNGTQTASSSSYLTHWR